MDLGIKDRVAFVGASSKGLGKAIALGLANEGVHVIINGRNKDSLNATKSEIEDHTSVQVMALQGDLSNAGDRERIIKKALEAYGRVDILVTNTGGPPAGKFTDFSKKDWDDAFELLLGSAVGMIEGFLPGMKRQQWGRIIAITSQAVKQPVDNLILSNAVRASVAGLIKSLSNELGPDHITVNNVMPGFIETDRLQSLLKNNPAMADTFDELPLQRVGQPREFADAVVFLASERASYITGVALAVDGGRVKNIL